MALKNPLELAIIAPDCSRRQEPGLNEPAVTSQRVYSHCLN